MKSLRVYTEVEGWHGHSFAELLSKVARDDGWLLQLSNEPELLGAMLPYAEKIDPERQAALRLLSEKAEGKRYHALVVTMLHRLGLQLSCPVLGSFRPAKQSRLALLDFRGEILSKPVGRAVAGRALLRQMLRSMAWCGLLHYAVFISNLMRKLFYEMPTQDAVVARFINECTNSVLPEPVMTFRRRSDNYRSPLPLYLAELSPLEGAEPQIVQASRNSGQVVSCRHGLLMKRFQINANAKMACVLYGTDEDCGQVADL
jgi:hypothetical protein